LVLVAVLALTLMAAAPAQAAREAKGGEARAIEKAFLKGRTGETTIEKILVSTEDPPTSSRPSSCRRSRRPHGRPEPSTHRRSPNS
jgi:hypothetical protein